MRKLNEIDIEWDHALSGGLVIFTFIILGILAIVSKDWTVFLYPLIFVGPFILVIIIGLIAMGIGALFQLIAKCILVCFNGGEK